MKDKNEEVKVEKNEPITTTNEAPKSGTAIIIIIAILILIPVGIGCFILGTGFANKEDNIVIVRKGKQTLFNKIINTFRK